MRAHAIRRRCQSTVLIALALLTGCFGTIESEGSCGLRARLDGRWYLANGGINAIPSYGEPLGSAVVPPCGGDDGFRINAVSIVGVSPKIAFASPQYEDAVFVAEPIDSLPAQLERLRRPPRCASKDAPIMLHGTWLGIIEPDGDTEVDLVPPYKLSMRVDEASDARFERTFLTIHVGRELGRPLSQGDVRTSLWEGGNLSVTATCTDGRFWAEQVTASPPS